MDGKYGLARLVATVLLVLLLSAAWTAPALADEAPPPPEETPGEVKGEGYEEPVVEAPVLEGEAGGEPADEPRLSELLEGTEMVVTEAEGMAKTISAGDPIWCPAGVTPNSGAGGCTTAYGSFNALLTDLSGSQPAANGVIWVEKTYVGTTNDPGISNFTLDGAGAFSTMANYSLTVQGGWNGLGTKTVDKASPSQFNASLNFLGWNADVNLNDLYFTGVPGTETYAVMVTTTRKINVEGLKVDTNGSRGAYLDNAAPGAVSDVNVTMSQFLNNSGGDGLLVFSYGNITLKDVISDGNSGAGAYLYNNMAATPKKVTIASGYNEFNGNGANGLRVQSSGAVTIKDLTAMNNGNVGAIISNTIGTAPVTLTGGNVVAGNSAGGISVNSNGKIAISNLVASGNSGGYGAYLDNSTAASAQPVLLTGTNEFKFNGTGLWVQSQGAITVNNVAANNNDTGDGAYLFNAIGFTSNVTVKGVNTFNDNGEYGLEVYSYGVITTQNLTANDNGYNGGGYGAHLDNHLAATPKPVTMTGTNSFNDNVDGGLYVESLGAIKANQVEARDNSAEGVWFDNGYAGATGTVTLTGYNLFYGNEDDGLIVYSTRAITLSNLEALHNSGYGVYLGNDFDPSKPQNVTVKGYVNVNNNLRSGMEVYSYGAVTLEDVNASNNGIVYGGVGLLVDTCRDLGSGCTALTPRPVAIKGYGNYDSNADGGLVVTSLGPITLENVRANNNSDNGATLDNSFIGAKGGITVKGTNEFNQNSSNGLVAFSLSNILIADIDSMSNGGSGANLNTTYGTAGNVVVGTNRPHWCSSFSDNYYDGLEIYATGTVTLYNLCADDNGQSNTGGYGLQVDNTFASSPKPVTLNGSNSFDNNYDAGLEVHSLGAIKTSNLEANDTRNGFGAFLDNSSGGNTSLQPVIISGSNTFDHNANDGLTVQSYGEIKLSNVHAAENGWGGGGDGVILDNYHGDALANKGITQTGDLHIRDNNGQGLVVNSLGNIKFNNMNVHDNIGPGAFLNNEVPGGVGAITLTGGWNAFQNNGAYGLMAFSNRAISINSDLIVNDNGSFGAILDNSLGFGPVSVKGYVNVARNDSYGLYVYANGAVQLQNVGAYMNDQEGVVVDNAVDPAKPQNVIINGTNDFNDNGRSGLQVESYGVITLNNLNAYNNGWNGGGYGAYLDNCGFTFTTTCNGLVTGKGITLKGDNHLEGNMDTGLWATSLGAITINNLNAHLNGMSASVNGAYLDNQFETFDGYPAVGNITLTGWNHLNNNYGWGLYATSHGSMNLSNLEASGNYDGGAYLDAWGWYTPQNITLTGVNSFRVNGDFAPIHIGDGLQVYADGQITISNLTASRNAYNGAVLVNYSGGSGITLTGWNYFNYNYNDGLYFISDGVVNLSRVTADLNGDDGLEGGAGNISVTCGSMTGNGDLGWDLFSPGLVTLKGVNAYLNGNPLEGQLTGGGTLVTTRGCP